MRLQIYFIFYHRPKNNKTIGIPLKTKKRKKQLHFHNYLGTNVFKVFKSNSTQNVKGLYEYLSSVFFL